MCSANHFSDEICLLLWIRRFITFGGAIEPFHHEKHNRKSEMGGNVCVTSHLSGVIAKTHERDQKINLAAN